MRKNSARKWVHAVLKLLPVLIIPIFAIYSHRHTIDNLEVVTTTDKYVKLPTNEVNSVDDLIIGNYYSLKGIATTYNMPVYYNSLTEENNAMYMLNTYFDNYFFGNDFAARSSYGPRYLYYLLGTNVDVMGTYSLMVNSAYFNFDSGNVFKLISMPPSNIISLPTLFKIEYVNGSRVGNFTDFYDYFQIVSVPDEYLPIEYQEGVTTTYNDTDIGSQFIYSMYIPIEKYFNFNKVFNFQQIYDWLSVNIFGGTAPLSAFIVWNILIYEFIIDLIFLLYMFFTFLIDFTMRLIDSFMDRSIGGGKR